MYSVREKLEFFISSRSLMQPVGEGREDQRWRSKKFFGGPFDPLFVKGDGQKVVHQRATMQWLHLCHCCHNIRINAEQPEQHCTVVNVVFQIFPLGTPCTFRPKAGVLPINVRCTANTNIQGGRLLVLILRSQRRFEWVEWRGLPSSATHLSEFAANPSQGPCGAL